MKSTTCAGGPILAISIITTENGDEIRQGRYALKKSKGQAKTAATKKRKRDIKGSIGQARKQSTAARSLDLPRANFWDLEFGEKLGSGRNGSVFKVRWGGKSVPLKQFDVGRDGDEPFEKDICAYARTRKAWGKLVPESLFLSELPSGGVKFLGLQLGRPLRDKECENEDLAYQQWRSVLNTLEDKYGIQHNDARGNAVVVETDGKERLVGGYVGEIVVIFLFIATTAMDTILIRITEQTRYQD